jgi:hypothetical protein
MPITVVGSSAVDTVTTPSGKQLPPRAPVRPEDFAPLLRGSHPGVPLQIRGPAVGRDSAVVEKAGTHITSDQHHHEVRYL